MLQQEANNINRSTVEFKGFVSIARKSSASILIEAQWNLKPISNEKFISDYQY